MKIKRAIKRYLAPSRYLSKATLDLSEIEVIEFRRMRNSERYDSKYEAWSRIYEYPLLLDSIKRYVGNTDISVHNSSWGFEGVHIVFKEDLERLFKSVKNSDILPSKEPNTSLMDITKPPAADLVEHFDVVLNVSTVEEVDDDHLSIIENLFKQVKKGGYLMITFDLPGMQLGKIEKFLKTNIARFDDELDGLNSAIPNKKFASLGCGFLVLKKV